MGWGGGDEDGRIGDRTDVLGSADMAGEDVKTLERFVDTSDILSTTFSLLLLDKAWVFRGAIFRTVIDRFMATGGGTTLDGRFSSFADNLLDLLRAGLFPFDFVIWSLLFLDVNRGLLVLILQNVTDPVYKTDSC